MSVYNLPNSVADRNMLLCLGRYGARVLAHVWPRIGFEDLQRQILRPSLPSLARLTAGSVLVPQSDGSILYGAPCGTGWDNSLYRSLDHQGIRDGCTGTTEPEWLSQLKQVLKERHLIGATDPPTGRSSYFRTALEAEQELGDWLVRAAHGVRNDADAGGSEANRFVVYIIASLADPESSALLWPAVMILRQALGSYLPLKIIGLLSTGIYANTERRQSEAAVHAALQQAAVLAREVGSIAVEIFVILVGIGFLLLEAPRIAAVIRQRLGAESSPYRHLAQSGRLLIDYVVVRTKVNLITGVGTGLFLAVLGVDFAVLWGFIAFVLSYVPYIGLVVAAIPPTLLALIEFGPAGAVAVIAAVALIDAAAENLVLPRMAGRDLNLSPFVVLFSVVFWGLIFGAVGVFLAIPLTIAVKLFLESWDETRWIGELLGAGEQRR